jgi:UBX domain-containing protein 1
MDVTGVNRERAEFYMESSNFELQVCVGYIFVDSFFDCHRLLQVALSSFYEDGPADMVADDSPDEVEVTMSSGQPAKKESKPSSGARNIKTLSSLNTSSSGDEGDEKGQAFYAGGSQTSGQQILGPPRKNPIKDYVSEVFKQAQSGNMETFEANESPSSSDGGARSFSGTGYRLGETSDDHVAIPSAAGSSRKKHDECDEVTVRVFRQGFTVDDGELRPYEDPRNRAFFESITHNEIPEELRKQGRNLVHVNVEDHLSEDYVKRTPKFKAFQGSGHTLGSPAPATTQEASAPTPAASGNPAENEAKAATELNVVQDQPTTMISIRLADGGRLSARFNLTHTVQDIRRFIGTARPEYSARNFTLLTTFPNKELANPGDTIAQAGLQNAAILQRLQ